MFVYNTEMVAMLAWDMHVIAHIPSAQTKVHTMTMVWHPGSQALEQSIA